MNTPKTDDIQAQINASGGSDTSAFHDMLNHARQMEMERNEWAERWADLNRVAVEESCSLEQGRRLLRIVLNGGIDDGIEWGTVMDMVRDFLKPNPTENRTGHLVDGTVPPVVGRPNDLTKNDQ